MQYKRHEAKAWVRELRDYSVTTTTPMLPDGSFDEAGMRHNIEQILKFDRARGIYLNSIYQEFWTLTMAERKRVVEVAVNAVKGRVPVIVGTDANCIAEVVELAQHAEQAGADLVMIWPPTFGQRSPAGVIEFYKQVTKHLEIGVAVYASSLHEIGFQITAPMLVELAKIENICAVKEASLSAATFMRTVNIVGDKLAVSMPLEEYWLYARLMMPEKAPQFMLGSSRPLYLQTEKRPLLRNFLEAVDAGDLKGANHELQEILSIANRLHNKYLQRGEHNVALTKAITGMLGFATGPVRPPITMPPAEDIEEARSVLIDAGLIDAGPALKRAANF